jgi:hypothetical protein
MVNKKEFLFKTVLAAKNQWENKQKLSFAPYNPIFIFVTKKCRIVPWKDEIR